MRPEERIPKHVRRYKGIASDWNSAIKKNGKSGRAGTVEELKSRRAPEETRGSKQIVDRESETEIEAGGPRPTEQGTAGGRQREDRGWPCGEGGDW